MTHVPDLTVLSPVERQTLMLLAQGHTAKSIAKTLQTSEGVINERLRQARRKAGISSSRELARLVATDAEAAAAPALMATANQNGEQRPRARAIAAVALLVGVAIAAGAATVGGQFVQAASPRVVSTFPAANAKIDAGKLTLRVTFDQPMRPSSYSFISFSPQTFPHCGYLPAQSPDLRTFALECVLEPHLTYDIGFNSPRFRHFVSAESGKPAVPAILRFRTR